LIPLYGRELGGGMTMIGLLWTFYSLPRAVANPLFGYLSDLFGARKNFVSFGLISSGILFLTIPLVGMFLAFVALRGLQGIALSATNPVASSLASHEKGKEGRGKALGLYDTARTAGGSIGPAVVGFLIGSYGFLPSFAFSGCCTILAGILVYFTISADYGPAQKERERWNVRIDLKYLSERTKRGIMATVKSPVFPFLVLITLRFIGRHAYSRFIPIYFQDIGFDEGIIGLIRSFRSGMTALVMIASGVAADRLGRRPLILFAVFCAAMEPFLLYWKPNLWQTFLIFAVGSMGWGAFIPAARAVVGDLTPVADRGKAYGSMGSAMLLGISIGPLIGGQIADAFSYRLDLLISSAFLGLILLLFFVFLQETL